MDFPSCPGYGEDDFRQHGSEALSRSSSTDVRPPFQHDVDRILYSTEFRSLAGKTQVIASDQLGGYHNRLTHSLKVAQIGKRLAVLLTDRYRKTHNDPQMVGPDPDLVEAAGLLHDIGHPPFGHIGEIAIRDGMRSLGSSTQQGGFQANAQNLRIATYLSVRRNRASRGLNLTRAALDASVKYPWLPAPTTGSYSASHWGCYNDIRSKTELQWVLKDSDAPYHSPTKEPDTTSQRGLRRPVEEQIMDWADEITYACHDVEDFYRAGLLPLDQIIEGVPRRDVRKGEPNSPGFETSRFVNYLVATGEFVDEEHVIQILWNLQNQLGRVFPFEATAEGRGRSVSAVSSLLTYFMGPKPERGEHSTTDGYRVTLRPVDNSPTLTRYGAVLDVHDELKDACRVLNKMIWFYVIDRPSLATQQQGQKKIVSDLITWFAHDPKRLLPPDRREEWADHRDNIRAAADAVASLTEAEAVRIHRRMSGLDWGQITDLA